MTAGGARSKLIWKGLLYRFVGLLLSRSWPHRAVEPGTDKSLSKIMASSGKCAITDPARPLQASIYTGDARDGSVVLG